LNEKALQQDEGIDCPSTKVVQAFSSVVASRLLIVKEDGFNVRVLLAKSGR
jgi:hypothetical protein